MCFQLSAITQTPSSTPTKYSDTRMQKNKYITDCVCCFLEQMCYEAYRCRVCSGCYLENMACGLAFKINRFVVWFGLCGGPLGLNSLLWSKDGILCIVIAIFETLTFFFVQPVLLVCVVFPSLPFPSLPFPSLPLPISFFPLISFSLFICPLSFSLSVLSYNFLLCPRFLFHFHFNFSFPFLLFLLSSSRGL